MWILCFKGNINDGEGDMDNDMMINMDGAVATLDDDLDAFFVQVFIWMR